MYSERERERRVLTIVMLSFQNSKKIKKFEFFEWMLMRLKIENRRLEAGLRQFPNFSPRSSKKIVELEKLNK